jgi:hypothetical protein
MHKALTVMQIYALGKEYTNIVTLIRLSLILRKNSQHTLFTIVVYHELANSLMIDLKAFEELLQT